MFKCKKCIAHENEILFLRGQVQNLSDRLLAVTHPHALAAVREDRVNKADYFGSGFDEQYISYDEFGQKVLLEKERQ